MAMSLCGYCVAIAIHVYMYTCMYVLLSLPPPLISCGMISAPCLPVKRTTFQHCGHLCTYIPIHSCRCVSCTCMNLYTHRKSVVTCKQFLQMAVLISVEYSSKLLSHTISLKTFKSFSALLCNSSIYCINTHTHTHVMHAYKYVCIHGCRT